MMMPINEVRSPTAAEVEVTSYLRPTTAPDRRLLEKWSAILERCKQEAGLLQQLIALSTTGWSQPRPRVSQLRMQLTQLVDVRMSDCRHQLKEMQSGFPAGESTFGPSQISEMKRQVKALMDQYGELKMRVLEQMIEAYPVTIV